MIKRDKVLSIITANRERLNEMGVESLLLFGSVARDEARQDSDVDFLVEFNCEVGLFEFIKIRHFLEDILNCPVDMGTIDALREHMRIPVTKDIIRAL